MTLLERLERRSVRDEETGCWLWLGYCLPNGYGRIAQGHSNPRYVHRVAYELLVGPIPDGLLLDHECHNTDLRCLGGDSCGHRRCWNPAHLETVTYLVNRHSAGVRL